MLDAIKLICVGVWHVAVLVGLLLGVGRILGCIARVFALPEPWASSKGGSTDSGGPTVGEKTGKPYNIIGFSAYLLFYNEFAIVNFWTLIVLFLPGQWRR
jgi:hypothetical protein